MSPFEILGLPESATVKDLQLAWRRLATIHHPDRGGDTTEFHSYHTAYEQALVIALAPKACDECGGTGQVVKFRGFMQVRIMCQTCKGAGEHD